MCGINGIFAYADAAPPVDEAELLRTREYMLKRGPDGAGLWISTDRRVGLAHRRLAIIDLSETGAQPMATADGRLTITFNGEIYNYRELRRELEAKGYVFRSQSDTEVLLHLYADRGAEMVHALRGMYAFGIWDARGKMLFLARDPYGIKPLYYADDGGTIRFASQVKALLKGGAIDTTSDPAGHVGFFLWGHVPEPYTLHKGIRALLAGSTLSIGVSGQRRERRFFDIATELADACAASTPMTHGDVQYRLRAAMLDTVRHHMVADVPVGMFLSSGLDSSTLTALAGEVGASELRTITLGFREFKGTSNDEVPLAEAIARHYGTLHQTHWIENEDFRLAHDRILESMDQPSTDGVNAYFVSKAATDAGLKVAMSGLGGDELFRGYPSFRQIPALAGALRPLQWAPWIGRGFRLVATPILRRFTSPKYAALLEYGSDFAGAYLLRRGMYMPWELPEVLDGEMIRVGWQELSTLSRLRQTMSGVAHAQFRITAIESAWYMRNQLLRDTDWASMAHSLEIRLPFVDVGLLRAVAPLLAGSNVPDKRAMAQTPARALPAEVLARKKTGFSVPMQTWTTADKESRPQSFNIRRWAMHVYKDAFRQKRVLISTLWPGGGGGVATMTKKIVGYIRARGYDVALACHAPYQAAPELSVPFWRLLTRFPRVRLTTAFDDVPCYEVGGYFPELEFARCFPSRAWKNLAERFHYCIAVSGSVHAALPILLQGRSCLAWVATPYLPDIVDRARAYPWIRRVANRMLDTPACQSLEVRGLGAATVLALSDYTAAELQKIVPGIAITRMPMPIDREAFAPRPESVVVGRIGFSGRMNDVRKNMPLLLHAAALCRARGFDITVRLAGAVDQNELEQIVAAQSLAGKVDCLGQVQHDLLPGFYRTLDVFVMPSLQEGLGIVGLEAMACGCPVVSTRCGGPEDYVRAGVNGHLVDFSPEQMAEAICAIVGDRALRQRMSEAAVATVRRDYGDETVRGIFWSTFDRTYGVEERVQ